jgi:hypothetical protein
MMPPKQYPIQPATATANDSPQESDGLESGHTWNAAERHASPDATPPRVSGTVEAIVRCLFIIPMPLR